MAFERARAAAAVAAVVSLLTVSGGAQAQSRTEPVGLLYLGASPAAESPREPREPCKEDCFLLASLVLRGSVSGSLSFELRGGVRAGEAIKVPLFGPPGQVRLDDVTIDGAPAPVGFDGDRYHVFTAARSFVVRGRLTLGSDQMLAVPGPLVSVDAHLSTGRLVEGERLSGVTGAVLHFDPMTDGAEAKPKTPPVFRLARAVRFGRETTFTYKLTASQSTDLGTIRLPLRYAEKVSDVQGAAGWSAEGGELLLPTSGHDAEITIAGTMPLPSSPPLSFTPDGRSAYEWWLIEADPEHRVEVSGEAKLVETSQSPLPPSFPGALVYLVQKGQAIEVDARSLVRGDVLAAVARTHRRHVALTGGGELISDETISYDNNGLDHLMLEPAGRALYLSTDQEAQQILHATAGAAEVLVPMRTGSHVLRVQSLAKGGALPFGGVLTIPPSTFPLATSTAETVIGLPASIRPVVVLGGDHAQWAFGRADLVALVLGVALACFGFRTAKTRALASACTSGLWLVSHEAFVVVGAGLFLAGAVFLASRFLRGHWLLVASGALTVVALLGGRMAVGEVQLADEIFLERPELPKPEASSFRSSSRDPKNDITPVSLSFPTSERYVQTSRQLVSRDRPFVPRIVYVTSTVVAALHGVWLLLVGALVWAHKDRLLAVKAKIAERLTRRPTAPDPTTLPEAPPF